jgi:hypothetical protein
MRNAEPFLSMGIAPDVARITHALATRFLQPLKQFIFIVSQEKLRNTGVARFFRQ